MHTAGPSDWKISDQIDRGFPCGSAKIFRRFSVRISPISMGLNCAMAAIVVFDAASAGKPRQKKDMTILCKLRHGKNTWKNSAVSRSIGGHQWPHMFAGETTAKLARP